MALAIAIVTGILAPLLGYFLWKARRDTSKEEQYLKDLDANNKAISKGDEQSVNTLVDDYLNRLRSLQSDKRGQEDSKDKP